MEGGGVWVRLSLDPHGCPGGRRGRGALVAGAGALCGPSLLCSLLVGGPGNWRPLCVGGVLVVARLALVLVRDILQEIAGLAVQKVAEGCNAG